eukprot:500106-Amorphochlora_amoeboformis.AAC.1
MGVLTLKTWGFFDAQDVGCLKTWDVFTVNVWGVLTVNMWDVFARLQSSNLLTDSLSQTNSGIGCMRVLTFKTWGVLTVKTWGVLTVNMCHWNRLSLKNGVIPYILSCRVFKNGVIPYVFNLQNILRDA